MVQRRPRLFQRRVVEPLMTALVGIVREPVFGFGLERGDGGPPPRPRGARSAAWLRGKRASVARPIREYYIPYRMTLHLTTDR